MSSRSTMQQQRQSSSIKKRPNAFKAQKSVRFLDLVETGKDNRETGNGRNWETTIEYSCYPSSFLSFPQHQSEGIVKQRILSPPCIPKRRSSLEKNDISKILRSEHQRVSRTGVPSTVKMINKTNQAQNSRITSICSIAFPESPART